MKRRKYLHDFVHDWMDEIELKFHFSTLYNPNPSFVVILDFG
jgi:hypothetical protein